MARDGKVAEIKKEEDQTNFKLISKDGDEWILTKNLLSKARSSKTQAQET
jgi:hypothetical protein